MRSGGWLAALLACALTGCGPATGPSPQPTSSQPSSSQPGIRMAWRQRALPGSPEVLTLTPGRPVLAGTRLDGEPGLLKLTADPEPDPGTVRLRPHSGYARIAGWLQVSAGAPGLVAVGGARGGAHANVRWSVWRGSAETLTEEPQVFWVFGGEEAGDLVGAGYLGDDPLVVGSWAGRHGADIAVWRPHGTRWARDPSRGALASTATELKSAAAVAGSDGRITIAGDALALGRPSVAHPAVWTATATTGPWTQRLLPGDGRARNLACSAAGDCLVVGVTTDLSARAWRLAADGTVTELDLPPVTLTDGAPVPAPALAEDGTAWLALPTDSGSTLLRIDGSGAATVDTPAGTPTAIATADGRLYLATRTGETSSLWVGR